MVPENHCDLSRRDPYHARLRSVSIRIRAALLAIISISTAGCRGERIQSSLHPEGPAATAIAQLWWVLLIILGLYAVGVFILLILACFRQTPSNLPRQAEDTNNPALGQRFILIGGVILPGVILTGLLIYSLEATRQIKVPESGLTIQVIGHRWWWEVRYPDFTIVTANEIIIPAGQPVRLELSAHDVIHSFWVPQLHGKMDLIPGHTNIFWMEATSAGVYRGQCAEYCGVQHANMAFNVSAMRPDQFVDWITKNRGKDNPGIPSLEEATFTPSFNDGHMLFKKHGCAVCHAISGTSAVGIAGPDLTMMASRLTIGAGTVENTRTNLIRWLTDPSEIKPGVNMPGTHAPASEIEAIADYLLQERASGGGT